MELIFQLYEVKFEINKINKIIGNYFRYLRWPIGLGVGCLIRKIAIFIQYLIRVGFIVNDVFCVKLQREFFCSIINRLLVVDYISHFVYRALKKIFQFLIWEWRFEIINKFKQNNLYNYLNRNISSILFYEEAAQVLILNTTVSCLEVFTVFGLFIFQHIRRVCVTMNYLGRFLVPKLNTVNYSIIKLKIKCILKTFFCKQLKGPALILIKYFKFIPNLWKSQIFFKQWECYNWVSAFSLSSMWNQFLFDLALADFEFVIKERIFNFYYRKFFGSYQNFKSKFQCGVGLFFVKCVDEILICCENYEEKDWIIGVLFEILVDKQLIIDFLSSKILLGQRNTNFLYLGFEIRNHDVRSRNKYIRLCCVKFWGDLVILPCQRSVLGLKSELRGVLSNVNASVSSIIYRLNRIVYQWGMYYSFSISSVLCLLLDSFIHFRVWRFLKQKFSKIGKTYLAERFFFTGNLKYQTNFKKWHFHDVLSESTQNLLFNNKIWFIWLVSLRQFCSIKRFYYIQ